jgi:hypothetical protein
VQVTVFVHPIDTEAHTTLPGWRWAVHLGGNPYELDSCMNAGWTPTENEARMDGETVGVAVLKALRVCGVPARYAGVQRLDRDPIPTGRDFLQKVVS